MKKLIPIILALVPVFASAQTVIDTRPAHDSGKALSYEEVASYKVNVYPKKFRGTVPEFAEEQSPAFVEVLKGHSLFYKDSEGTEHPVAISEDDNITFGDVASRSEFGIDGGTFWSPGRTKLAFYRKDESRVTDFPLLDINSRTGQLKSIKYPMNGMDSELVTLGIFDLESGRTVYADVTDFTEERYLTNISWSPDDRFVFIQVEDRSQHHMHLNMYDANDGHFVRTILTEDNERWVEPLDCLHFIEGSYDFIYRTDNRDGFRNLYRCDTLGNVKRLTCVDADVAYVGNDGRYLYYTSAEVSPVENHLFRLDLKKKNAKPQRLTGERGWHEIILSPDYKYFVDSYSSFNVPDTYKLKTTDGKLVRTLQEGTDPLAEYATGKVEFGTVKSADGQFDNYYRLFYPVNFDPSKKYPLVVYVYGGPHSQMVKDSWIGGIRMWEMLMTQKGYFVYVQDNRGTMNRGAEFEKAINRQCGQVEMADQIAGINELRKLPYIDNERIGVGGWSYGGFMTLTLTLNHPEIFKVAVAGGPVIDWQWYEIMYGERYMDTEKTNPEGFAKTRLTDKAKNLRSKLLICQGAVDNTVVWENSLSFLQNCISNNIPVEYFPYPCAEHNMRNIERVHLYNKITEFYLNNL